MKVAIVGCGNISRLHFAAVDENPLTELVAAVDIKPERAQKFAEKYGINAYTSYEEMLEKEKPDAVHICTPHYLHTPYAITALGKNINVLSEKPCSISDEEVEALRKAQASSSAVYAVCFQNRYNDCVGQIIDAVQSGEMGKLEGIRAFVTWDRRNGYYVDDWHGTLEKEGGCLLINQAIHTLDLIEQIGGKCKALTAKVGNFALKGVIEGEDTASILFELESGASAVFYGTTAYSSNAPVLIEVAFENGTLRTEGERLFEITPEGDIISRSAKAGTAKGKQYWGSGHSALINDFYDCIANGRKFEIDAFSGGNAAKIVVAAYRSSQTGEKVYL